MEGRGKNRDVACLSDRVWNAGRKYGCYVHGAVQNRAEAFNGVCRFYNVVIGIYHSTFTDDTAVSSHFLRQSNLKKLQLRCNMDIVHNKSFKSASVADIPAGLFCCPYCAMLLFAVLGKVRVS